ncbi:MAG: LysR family transcriptional regulator [Gammaproteobacteria bacterium]|nr:LysR family transcriptional regulator [Gammaproteobacteria bacterium]
MFPRSIRYLLAVAEHHSFTRAAESLFVSQPTLSQRKHPVNPVINRSIFPARRSYFW